MPKAEENVEFHLKEKPVEQAPLPEPEVRAEQIEIPQLWPRVSDTLAKHRKRLSMHRLL